MTKPSGPHRSLLYETLPDRSPRCYFDRMDVLTDTLASMRTGRASSVRTEARAPWGLRFRRIAGAGFHVVLHGTCWLLAPKSDPLALSPGDLVFLRTGCEHVLCDAPGSPVQDFVPDRIDATSPIGRITIDGPGATTVLLCGAYQLDQARPHPLLRTLPEVIYLPARPGRHPALQGAISLLGAELEDQGPGSDGIVPALVDALLLYVIRAWLDEHGEGWALALGDASIAHALRSIHQSPEHPWTVEELAAQAALSRPAFARRFTALVGEPPLTYLTRWRMTLSARLLAESNPSLKMLAERTGYGNEFAFAKAFKREFGVAPGQYRRDRQAASAAANHSASRTAGE
jgi:AraC-like DNA-binding protein